MVISIVQELEFVPSFIRSSFGVVTRNRRSLYTLVVSMEQISVSIFSSSSSTHLSFVPQAIAACWIDIELIIPLSQCQARDTAILHL
jgi:hypothetical protein